MVNHLSTISDKLLLKLTALQRADMLACVQFEAEIENRIKRATEKTQVIEFSHSELDTIENELFLISDYVRHPQKQRIVAVQKKVADLLIDARRAELEIQPPTSRLTEVSDLIFQFKIILSDIRPAIWRRIQVRNCSLAELHDCLQAAFGWGNYHMHEFEIDGERYGIEPEDFGFGPETHDESDVMLSELLIAAGTRSPWKYEYDFGDGWKHWLIFEGYPTRKGNYPLCTDGERACPPEDIGGPWGYAEYLEAIADPRHESHEEFIEWSGPFDPEAFDASKATQEMKRI
ncbi:MAG: plasmid pRiA4b ORF-3 family protein [Planctomycetaceae bacterium]|nr:plasmid pRiA4b ORF-3 family protein [Planctomycetaceae bacterium]